MDKNAKICTVLPDQRDVELVNVALAEKGFRKITAFKSAKEAYEVATRQQFDLFVIRMEMPDMPGVVLVQKLRATGNYGHETHLFLCNKLVPEILNVLFEFDIGYVLAAPFSKATVGEKLAHLIKCEASLSAADKSYREARAALFNGIPDMAAELAEALLAAHGKSERVYLLLGDIAAAREDVDGMIQHYKAAQSLNPKSAVAAHKLGGALLKKGHSMQAALLLDIAAKLNPYNVKALENAGLSHFDIKEFGKAEAFASQLRTVDQGNKTAGEIQVKSKIARGDFSGLTDALRDSHDEKEIVSFLNNAGVKLAQGDKVEEALRMYQSCLAQLEGSKYLYAVHYNIGLAYRRLGDVENAIASYERSRRLKPDFAKAEQAIRELRTKKAS